MKKTKKIYLLLLLIVGLFLLFRYYEGQCILSVLNQGNDAVRNAKLMVHRNGEVAKTRFNLHRYVDGLYKIDTSRCPKEFQLAWLDYVQACERVQRTQALAIIDDFIAIVTYSPIHMIEGIAKVEKTSGELLLARQNLERVALEYDIRVTHM